MNISKSLIYGLAFAIAGAAPVSAPTVASAQAGPFNFVCQGPLRLNDHQQYAFKWAATGAGEHFPLHGECTWYDRAARGSEINAMGGNVFCSPGATADLGEVREGQFVHLAVSRDETGSPANCISEAQNFGIVFTSNYAPGPDN